LPNTYVYYTQKAVAFGQYQSWKNAQDFYGSTNKFGQGTHMTINHLWQPMFVDEGVRPRSSTSTHTHVTLLSLAVGVHGRVKVA
jgi:hypothetical protein